MNDQEYMKRALAGEFKLSFTAMLLKTLAMLKDQDSLSHIHTSNEVQNQLVKDGIVTWEDPNIELTPYGKELVSTVEITGAEVSRVILKVENTAIDDLVDEIRFNKIAIDCVVPYLQKLSEQELMDLLHKKGMYVLEGVDAKVFAVAKLYMNDWDRELPDGMSDNDEIARFILGIQT